MASPAYMKLIFQIILYVLFTLCNVVLIAAQQREPLPPRQASEFEDVKPKPCWWYGHRLEDITLSTPANENIIVISRLGEKDSKTNQNRRRLHNVKAYWTLAMGERRDPKTIILAEGEPVKGRGQIEFYVRGQLVWIFKVYPNSDLNAADCYGWAPGETPCAEDWQKQFYPCKDYVDKQKQRRKIVPKKRKSC